MNVERISAITIRVNDMAKSVHFYNKLLGLKILYGGEDAYFSSLRTSGATTDLVQAIQAHKSFSDDEVFGNSEANAVIDKFNLLTDSQKQDIINFLRSL